MRYEDTKKLFCYVYIAYAGHNVISDCYLYPKATWERYRQLLSFTGDESFIYYIGHWQKGMRHYE